MAVTEEQPELVGNAEAARGDASAAGQVQFTVIIPAHNEEAVIRRCLVTLLADAPANHSMEIIVAANGCRDRTVAIAKEAAPRACVLDLSQASKIAAINAANAAASHANRIYLDADIQCSFASALALAEVLGKPDCMTASPAIRLNLEQADWMVRAYYRVWLAQPYARSGNGGAGCYGLSQAARDLVGDFPPIIGDDIWIHTRFAPEQKRYVDRDRYGNPVFTLVYPPRRAIEQVRVEARRRNGNVAVLESHPSPYNLTPDAIGGIRLALRNGSRLSDIGIFYGMKLAARLLAAWLRWQGQAMAWSRDESSRAV